MKVQNKKASSASTPKASHLTVIPSTGNRPMNNSTAVNLNNQDASCLAYKTNEIAKVVNQSAYAIRSIGDVLEFNLRNDDCGNELGDSVVKGGFNHE